MPKPQTNRPAPPENLTDEALLEWDRITAELESVGKLDTADRALVTIYCRTWQAWHAAAQIVALDGPVVLLPNNWPGQSSEYKTMTETAKMLTAMLAQMGLTPSTRKTEAAPVENDAIEF